MISLGPYLQCSHKRQFNKRFNAMHQLLPGEVFFRQAARFNFVNLNTAAAELVC